MIPSAVWRYWRLNDPFCSERRNEAATTSAAKTANVFEWPVRINSKSFPLMYVPCKNGTYPTFLQRPMSDIVY